MTAATFNANPTTMNVDPGASFPCRLHRMLTDIDQLAQNDSSMAHLPKIISWCADGRSFKIHDRKKFVDTVMPIWFSRLKYTSFVRGISGHGFTRVRCAGPANGAVFHEDFVREQPELASRIKKINRKSSSQLPSTNGTFPAVVKLVRQLSETSTASNNTVKSISCTSQVSPVAPGRQCQVSSNFFHHSLFAFMKQLPCPSHQHFQPSSNKACVWPVPTTSSSCMLSQTTSDPDPVVSKLVPLSMDSFSSDKLFSIFNSSSSKESLEELILADLDLPGDDFECPWDFLEPLPLL